MINLLSACSNNNSKLVNENIEQNDTVITNSPKTEKTDELNNDMEEESSIEKTNPADGHLLASPSGNMLYVVDDEGNKLAGYDTGEIGKKLNEAGMAEPDCYYDKPVAYGDGIMFFAGSSVRYGSECEVYAYDTQKEEALKVWEADGANNWLHAVDYYNGRLYITSDNDKTYSEESELLCKVQSITA